MSIFEKSRYLKPTQPVYAPRIPLNAQQEAMQVGRDIQEARYRLAVMKEKRFEVMQYHDPGLENIVFEANKTK